MVKMEEGVEQDVGARKRKAGLVKEHSKHSMSTVVIVNTDSPLGLATIRSACRLGLHVVSLSVRGHDKLLRRLPYTNPELDGLVRYVYADEADLHDPAAVVERSGLLDGLATVELLVTLNATEDVFEKWDLVLVEELFKRHVLTARSAVVLGRSSEKTIYTTNGALERYVERLAQKLGAGGVYVSNLVQLGAMAGDEEYVANSLTGELLRNDFRVAKIDSLAALLSYVVFYLLPGLMLGYAVDAKRYIAAPKSKND